MKRKLQAVDISLDYEEIQIQYKIMSDYNTLCTKVN